VDGQMDINIALEVISENIKISSKESMHYYKFMKQAMVRQKMLRTSRSKATGQTAVVKESKQNECG
jgi:hypothetical protein